MEAYGRDGVIGSWVIKFLRDRRQGLVLGDDESKWQFVTSSVHQGSGLRPLLFVIFNNDLPEGYNGL